MQVHFTCRHCGKKLRADPERAGKRAVCTRCQMPVDIPGMPERSTTPDPLADELVASGSPLSQPEGLAALGTADRPRRGSVDAALLEEMEEELPDVPPPTPEELQPKRFGKGFLDAAPSASTAPADDSYGIASMYLAGVSFMLFLAPTIMGGYLQAILGLFALLFFALINAGCLYVAWRGLQLAKEARVQADASGKGHAFALAGRLANGMLLFLNLAMIVVLIIAMVMFQQGGSNPLGGGGLGGMNPGGILKVLEEYKKALDGINP